MVTVPNPTNQNSTAQIWGRGIPAQSTGRILRDQDFTELGLNRDGTRTLPRGGAIGLAHGAVVIVVMREPNADIPDSSSRNGVRWVRVSGWRAGGGVGTAGNNLIPPGTGEISLDGISLLKEYENLGVGNMIYNESGELIAILSVDVEGHGNITFGFGVLFRPGDADRLMRDYGLNFRVGERVSVDVATRMMQNYLSDRMPALHSFTRDNSMWLTQHQLDALVIHRYLRPASINNEPLRTLLIEMFDHPLAANNPNFSELYHRRLHDAMVEEMRRGINATTFNRFISGWTNRIRDTLELFFYGDSVRNH